jgi:hypothetical protein
MAQGDDIRRLHAEFTLFRETVENRSEKRDDQFAMLESRLAVAEQSDTSLEARIIALEGKPGIGTYLSVIVGGIILLGSLGAFILTREQAVQEAKMDAWKEKVKAIDENFVDIKTVNQIIAERGDKSRQDLAALNALVPRMQAQLDALEREGHRNGSIN